ncbi:MAG: response regulator transcription factor [Bacteroidota bacterium]
MKKHITKKRTRLWIVDDNENYCILLSESLRFNKKIVVENYFHSIKEVLKALQKKRIADPEVMLLDIRMPEESGIDGLPAILQSAPDVKVIMLTSHDDPEEIQESLKNGATGYLLKNSTALDISRAIEKVIEGGSPLDPMITKKIVGMLMNNTGLADVPKLLTMREREIIHQIVRGMSNEKLAAKMNVSYFTITTHLKNIYKKLHVHSRHALMARAYKDGITGK